MKPDCAAPCKRNLTNVIIDLMASRELILTDLMMLLNYYLHNRCN